jgi:hypothetical protein
LFVAAIEFSDHLVFEWFLGIDRVPGRVVGRLI